MKKLQFFALLFATLLLLACNRSNGSDPSPVDPAAPIEERNEGSPFRLTRC